MKPVTVQMTFRLPRDMVAALKERARLQERSLASLVRIYLQMALQKAGKGR